MILPDVALALLINRTAENFRQNPPAYMTYTEHTHVNAPSLGRTQDINRSIAVRVADDYAVMRDLPNGTERTGQAFPIIAYFDPFSGFGFSYFANMKRVDIDLQIGKLYTLPVPEPDPDVNVLIPYNSFFASRYAPDSTETALHVINDPTSRNANAFYPSEVIEDPATHLPSHIELRVASGEDMLIALDYKVIEGHWVITHGQFSGSQHVAFLNFKVIADITFDDIAFPATPPDPRLAKSAPAASPSASPSAEPTPVGAATP
ncbi:MAG TPA: hypothetical protein VK760_08465 [Candidatus Acidoferrales bacterium]|jgi:hypothetical protein|nr:hypothetical protein [Candidatus Acidoferrales bacterium]